MRNLAFAIVALLPSLAMAQTFDSGWKIIQKEDLGDVSITGNGVRINNLSITKMTINQSELLGSYQVTASAMKLVTGRRDARVEIIGWGENTPTIVAGIVLSLSDQQAKKVQQGNQVFTAFHKEIELTKTYFVRVLVP